MSKSTILIWLLGLWLLILPFSVHGELGDYSGWRTLLNFSSPPPANNPLRGEEQTRDLYPLVANPAGFEDGFSPGRYRVWQTIQLAPETGAVCGNGSPFRFFVNRVANTSNTVVYFEPGGACWDYQRCRRAHNRDGIPDDYMSLVNPAARLISPLVLRFHPWDRVKTQRWNLVYVPYCTGDVHIGDRVAVYSNPDNPDESLAWHHNGLRNTIAVVSWLRENLPRPGQMLATGCSAGGTGSLANYQPLRRDLGATRGFLINDSGPIFPARKDANPADYPSVLLHNLIRERWGLDLEGGMLEFLKLGLPDLDLDDMGSFYPALSSAFPADRMGQTHFWQDLTYSAYSYERFFDDIFNEPDRAVREQRMLERWHKDTRRQLVQLASLPNFGYYYPWFRDVAKSHCTTIGEFANSDIQELGLELIDFINNVLDGRGAVMQASETETQADYNKPFNFLYWLFNSVF